ncbi:MAG: CAP domain-containing protein [Paracoccaceae bacterium]
MPLPLARLAPLVLAAALAAPAPAAALSCAKPDDLSAMRVGVIAAVNAQRRAHGLPALAPSAKLEKAAQRHACDIAWQQSYSHYGSDGSDLRARVKRAGYRLRMAAENTARGFRSADEVVRFWMQSPKHRANILMRGTRDIGLGQAYHDRSGGKRHWVLVVGKSG